MSGPGETAAGFFGSEEAGSQRTIDPETWTTIDRFLRDNPGGRERLVPLLHLVQERIGHLPHEVQEYIADKIGLSTVQVYGVISFYSRFTTTAPAPHQVRVCTGTACFLRRSGRILATLEEYRRDAPGGITPGDRFDLEPVRCIGACGCAPAVVIDDKIQPGATAENVLRRVQALSGEEQE